MGALFKVGGEIKQLIGKTEVDSWKRASHQSFNITALKAGGVVSEGFL